MVRSVTRRRPPRRGAILLVVLAMLALFAVVGLTFALYAESEAASSRIHREGMSPGEKGPSDYAQDDAEFLLGQFIYDVPDTDQFLSQSSIRGYSLARAMYGYDSTNPNNPSVTPFSGQGPFPAGDPADTINSVPGYGNVNRSSVINYAFFPQTPAGGPYGIFDPEWHQYRNTIGQAMNPAGTRQYRNVSQNYTYPDLKDLYLAVIDPNNGQVLQPSFFRTYSAFGSLAQANPNWLASNPAARLLITRPRPEDHRYPLNPSGTADFPYPAPNADGSVTGDVQNLPSPQGVARNDSLWMYPGGPVRVWKQNGKLYTPLIAPMIIDLNGKVNLAVAGNNLANAAAHASGSGLGPFEINPRRVFEQVGDPTGPPAEPETANASQQQLLTGNPRDPQAVGRYGSLGTPPTDRVTGLTSIGFNGGKVPPFYARVDSTGFSLSPGDRVNPIGSGTTPFPLFSNTRYFDGTNQTAKLSNHPGQLNPEYPDTNTSVYGARKFRMDDLRRLSATYGDKFDAYRRTDPTRLAPRRLGSANLNNNLPQSSTNPFFTTNDPANLVRQLTTLHSTTLQRFEITVQGLPTAMGSPPTPVKLGPIDLNRPLPDYRNDTTKMYGPDNMGNASLAQRARQWLARDIYVRLAALVGLVDGTNVIYVNQNTQPDYGYLRILNPASVNVLRPIAQVAVNMVDQIDSDDISTTFTFNPTPAGTALRTDTYLPNLGMGGVTPATLGDYVVFGTEAPRLALNEAYAVVENDRMDYNPAKGVMGPPVVMGKRPATQNFQKRYWLEVFNPMQADGVLSDMGLARLHYPAGTFGLPTGYSPYCITITDVVANAVDNPQNVTGSPKHPAAPMNVQLQVDKFEFDATDFPEDPAQTMPVTLPGGNTYAASTVSATNGGLERYVVQPHSGAGNGVNARNQNGFAMFGPSINFPGQTTNGMAGTPSATIRIQAQASAADPGKQAALETDTGVRDEAMLGNATTPAAVYLRRLANPYQFPNDPFEPTFNPNAPVNPYITVDRLENLQVHDHVLFGKNDMRNPATMLNATASSAKAHPFGATTAGAETAATGGGPLSSFFNTNSNATAPFRWLTHFDRTLTSPIEIIHTSAYPPTGLTQQFTNGGGNYNLHTIESAMMSGLPNGTKFFNGQTISANPNPMAMPAQLPTGFLARAFDLLTIRPAYSNQPVGAREHGRINLNTVWHPSVLQSLFDASDANSFADGFVFTPPAGPPTDVWGKLTRTAGMLPALRTPSYPDVTAADTPFIGANDLVNRGFIPGTSPNPAMTNYTFTAPAPADPTHAQAIAEPLRKIWNSTTTTSNTFLVIMTVGYFEVRNNGQNGNTSYLTDGRVYLGKELFNQSPGDLRQQFIAVIDRSNLSIDPNTLNQQAFSNDPNNAASVNWPAQPWFTTLVEDVQPGQNTLKVMTDASGNVYVDGKPVPLGIPITPTAPPPPMGAPPAPPPSLRIGFGDMNNSTSNSDGEWVGLSGAWMTPPVNGVSTITLGVPPWTSAPVVIKNYHPASTPISNQLLGNPGPQPGFRATDRRYRGVVPYFAPTTIVP